MHHTRRPESYDGQVTERTSRTVSSPPRVASFFAGIGGFDLGFDRAGLKTVWQCELKPFCATILEEHWPDVDRKQDIQEVKPDEVEEAEIWTAGFPCQDVSLARMGPREGLRGRQSGLFFKFAELLGGRLPRIVVLENVGGLLSSNSGRDFAVVARTLADLGYCVAWRVLDSRHFGVPQSRRRLFLVGSLGDEATAGEILLEPECREGNPEAGKENGKRAVSPFKEVVGGPKRGFVKKLAHCLYAESARHTGTDWSRNYVSYPDEGKVRRLTPLEAERLQGFPDHWTELRETSLSQQKLDSARYHALGNAVTVPVAEWIGEQIRSALAEDRAKPLGSGGSVNTVQGAAQRDSSDRRRLTASTIA